MLDKIALVLVIIGALNWGSIGLFSFDIVAWLFGGQAAMVSRIVYTLVLADITMNIVVISERDDNYCYDLAFKLYQKYGDKLFENIFLIFNRKNQGSLTGSPGLHLSYNNAFLHSVLSSTPWSPALYTSHPRYPTATLVSATGRFSG